MKSKPWIRTEIEPHITLSPRITMYCVRDCSVIWLTRELTKPFKVFKDNTLIGSYEKIDEAIEKARTSYEKD